MTSIFYVSPFSFMIEFGNIGYFSLAFLAHASSRSSLLPNQWLDFVFYDVNCLFNSSRVYMRPGTLHVTDYVRENENRWHFPFA